MSPSSGHLLVPKAWKIIKYAGLWKRGVPKSANDAIIGSLPLKQASSCVPDYLRLLAPQQDLLSKLFTSLQRTILFAIRPF